MRMCNPQSGNRKTADLKSRGSRQHIHPLISWALSVLVLLTLTGCGGEVKPAVPAQSAVPTDYSQARSWETLPNASQAVDVFFVYPTVYSAPSGTLGSTWAPAWNQSLAQAWSDATIEGHVTSKAGVFARAGTNLYVPYYQQASGLDVLNALLYSSTPQNAPAANQALEVAYTDIADAFDYYMAHFNKDANGNPRPFILAGHSQGSNLLVMLLENKFSDPSLRKQLVTAYVIGWSITAEDMNSYAESLQQIGICGIPETGTMGCIVNYNIQAYAGDWTQAPGPVKYGIVKPNAYSVNPISWLATRPGEIEPAAASNTANRGALFYQGQLGSNPAVSFALNPDTGNYTYEVANYTAAQSNQGGLVIDPSVLPAPAAQSNLTTPYNVLPMFHVYDYTFFYRNLEQNAIDRIRSFQAR
jgi:hypothetical protein